MFVFFTNLYFIYKKEILVHEMKMISGKSMKSRFSFSSAGQQVSRSAGQQVSPETAVRPFQSRPACRAEKIRARLV
jgi:hypothetical protein